MTVPQLHPSASFPCVCCGAPSVGVHRGQRVCVACFKNLTAKGTSNGLPRQTPQASVGHSPGTGSGGNAAGSNSGYFASTCSSVTSTSLYASGLSLGNIYPAGTSLAQAQQALGLPGYPVAAAPPPLPHELRVGELTAFRCWCLRDGLLWSMSANEPWAPGEAMTASRVTDYGEHEGIHAFKLKRGAYKYKEYRTDVLVSEVALWGEVCEHELGYRAEFARIVGLDKPGWLQAKEFAALRERYGVTG